MRIGAFKPVPGVNGRTKGEYVKFIAVPLKSCTVTVHDLNEIAHTLDVTAATLYEAVAQALAALRDHEWVGEVGKGLATVTVKVRQPEVTHVVKMQDFENWFHRQGRTPAEVMLKERLRQILQVRV